MQVAKISTEHQLQLEKMEEDFLKDIERLESSEKALRDTLE